MIHDNMLAMIDYLADEYGDYGLPKQVAETTAAIFCGSPAGYARHRRRGESPCSACREAKRLDSAAKRDEAKPDRIRRRTAA